MKNAAHFFVLPFTFIIFITMLCSTACAPSAEVVISSTPEPTASATLAPTATPTPTSTAIPTPAADEFGFADERKVELNQQFQDFLNYKGEYSIENIKKYLLPAGYGIEKIYNLGLIKGSSEYERVQCWLFDYFEKEGDLLLIVGFENNNNQRFVTVLNIPLHLIQLYSTQFGVGLIEVDGWSFYTGEKSAGSTNDLVIIKQYLSRNQPLMVDFVFIVFSDEEAKNIGGNGYVGVNKYRRDNFPYQIDLVSQVNRNGEKLEIVLDSGDKKIPKIEKLDDISNLENYTFPIINSIIITKIITN